MFVIWVCVVGLSLVGRSHQQSAHCLPTEYSSHNCSCIANDVLCQGIVSLAPVANPLRLNSLSIYDSPNLQLPNNTFNRLTLSRLSLANNRLFNHDFELNTFAGLTVQDLDLSNNMLTKIPEAVTNVANIRGLSVSGNPIENFRNEDRIMKKIGDTLLRFSFGDDDFDPNWPTELKHFPRLEELNVTRGGFSLMPIWAFYGFERTLKKLLIENTNLKSVPLAFGRLNYMTELRFDHNQEVGDFGMNVPLVHGILTHIGLITLKDDNITTFPQILGKFDNLTKLEMGQNALKFVSDQSANAIKRVTSLSLRNSSISRIPGALQDMKTLKDIDLSFNGIHSIQRQDLENLTSLETLNLNDNPLQYVSDHAFQKSIKLTRVEFRNTQLTNVPCAIKNLCLRAMNITVDLTGNKIECTCSLQWLYKWGSHDITSNRNQHLSVLGNCLTIDSTIQDYFDKTLKDCPDSYLCNDIQVNSNPDCGVM
ncbi:chondroadherin-like [Mizuhopecten yessoensis]|uniref:Leucine-rich repeat-containing protein 15 n=1 Tax=Mizuhopecten yessoensis TaxID=6573 RepID=A0A210QK39_MIZYE|nr:chondroadherin-like [Mizuhopecten yessoensis]OWF49113.1 Leucine-rich repeat-containing protein 15 [Mizuhopecten yessoensis]